MTSLRQATRRVATLLTAGLLLASCTEGLNWAHNDTVFSARTTKDRLKVDPDGVALTTGAFDHRAQQKLGDLRVRVVRTTPMHGPVSYEELDTELRNEAAKLGADAIVHVRYFDRTPDFLHWATLDATGTAVNFID